MRRPGRAAGPPPGPAVDFVLTSDWFEGPPDIEPPVRHRLAVPGWVCGVALAVAALLAVSALLVWRHRVAPHVTTVTAVSLTVGIDASGCPMGQSCDYAAQALPGLVQATTAVFPGAELFGGSTTWLAPSETPFSSMLVLSLPGGSTVTVSSQCAPGGGAVPSSSTIGPRDDVFVLPGHTGCSAAVSGHAVAGGRLPVSDLERLVHDPAIQLR